MVGLASEARPCPTFPAFSESYRAVTASPGTECCPGTNGGYRAAWALGDSTNMLEMPWAPNGTLRIFSLEFRRHPAR